MLYCAGWGFVYENGDTPFLMGDTAYNLFALAYCGFDTTAFLERRANQGFNVMRVRVPVSPYHPPDGPSPWQTWGGEFPFNNRAVFTTEWENLWFTYLLARFDSDIFA